MSLSRRTPLSRGSGLSAGKPLERKTPLRNTSGLDRRSRITPSEGGGDGPDGLGGKVRAASSPTSQHLSNSSSSRKTTKPSGGSDVSPTLRRGADTVANPPASIDLSAAARALANQARSAAAPRRELAPVPKPEKATRVRPTGFPPVVRQSILERDLYACARCGINVDRDGWPGYSLQHRDNRGSGGTSDPRTNQAGNGLTLCGSGTTGCHGWAEDNETAAARLGYAVKSWADPTSVPVYVHGRGWHLLDNNGGRTVCTEPTGGDAHAVARRKDPMK